MLHVRQDRTSALDIYSFLYSTKEDGAILGTWSGHDIAEVVIDDFGARYEYAGVAPRRRDGQFDMTALGSGEFIVRPGLIYKLVSKGNECPDRKLLSGAWDG